MIYANTPGKRDGDLDLSACEKMDDDEYWEYNRGIDFQAYKDLDSAILNYNPEKHGETLFLGFDVGRTHDATAIHLIGKMADGKKRDFARIELRNVEFEVQENLILQAYKELPVYRGRMDMTGIGRPVYERLHKKLGDRLEGVVFTPEEKEIMAIDVKRGLEQKEFLLSNDKEFHRQIHSIKRTSNGGKYFRYDAERNEKGHADSFWAWALANSAVVITDNKSLNFYAQRKQKKMELMQGLSPEKTEQLKKNLEDKQALYEEMRNQEFKQNVGDAAVITKGKSLRQINRKFGYEIPSKDW